METQINNMPELAPSQIPPPTKKWYKHKGLIAIGVLAIITVLVSWAYFKFNQPKIKSMAANSIITGTVMSNYQGCSHDDDCVLTVQTTTGKKISAVYGGGLTPNGACYMSSGFELVAGDQVELHGSHTDQDTFSLCGSDAYIKKLSTSTSPSNVTDSVQIISIHDLHVANATAKISPGSVIMIYWNAPAGFSIPLTGDKNGDGVWVSNGNYSAYLNYVSREIDNTPDAKNATGVYLVEALCPGAETTDCPLDKKVPFTEGDYSLYIKTDNGKTKSKDFKITISSTPSGANYENVSYTILNSKTECSDQGYNTVDYCNGALGKVDDSTKKYSVIIPNLWKTLPELKDTPGLVKLLFSNKDSLFFEAFGYGGGEGFAFDIGYYRYDFSSNGLTKLEWADGNCPTASPDGAYLADDYTVSGKTQIKVFSLAANKYVYSTTLPASQSVNDGTYGMGCNSSLKFESDDTLIYTIFDGSKPTNGQISYTAITDKKQPFPTVTQMFPAK